MIGILINRLVVRYNIGCRIDGFFDYLILFLIWVHYLAVCFLDANLAGVDKLIANPASSSEIVDVSLEDLVSVLFIFIIYLVDRSHGNLVIVRLVRLLFVDLIVLITNFVIFLVINTILSPFKRLNLVIIIVFGGGLNYDIIRSVGNHIIIHLDLSLIFQINNVVLFVIFQYHDSRRTWTFLHLFV